MWPHSLTSGKKKPPFYNLFQTTESIVCVIVGSKIITQKKKKKHF
jgi:hypothetical protein